MRIPSFALSEMTPVFVYTSSFIIFMLFFRVMNIVQNYIFFSLFLDICAINANFISKLYIARAYMCVTIVCRCVFMTTTYDFSLSFYHFTLCAFHKRTMLQKIITFLFSRLLFLVTENTINAKRKNKCYDPNNSIYKHFIFFYIKYAFSTKILL